jgi:hypothetical protein
MEKLIFLANHKSEFNDTNIKFIPVKNPEIIPDFFKYPEDYKWLITNYGFLVWSFHNYLVLEIFNEHVVEDDSSYLSIDRIESDREEIGDNCLIIGYDVHAAVYAYELVENKYILKQHFMHGALYNNLFELLEENYNELAPLVKSRG